MLTNYKHRTYQLYTLHILVIYTRHTNLATHTKFTAILTLHTVDAKCTNQAHQPYSTAHNHAH